jgi:hypothetical protein
MRIGIFCRFIVVAAALAFIASWSAAQAEQYPPGSWRQSCNNPRIKGSDDFTADCRTRDGRLRTSSIDLDSCGRGGPVGNDNGQLVCERYGGGWGGNNNSGGWAGKGVPQGPFRQSCRNERIEGSDDLVAECRRQNGGWRYTKIDLDRCRGQNIVNNNGHLECGNYRYGGDYGRYQLPPGSWQQSCRNARVVRDDLFADCQQRNGNWVRASLDLDDCRGQGVHNDNGRLRCGGQWNQGGGNQGGGGWNQGGGQGGGYRMPGGSWSQSCRNAEIRGDDLYAQCRDRQGNWHSTRIDLDRCKNRGLMNDNGELRCS